MAPQILRTPAVVDLAIARPRTNGANFKLAVEAKRVNLAFLFDPMMAVHTSNVQPLPHQITAIYPPGPAPLPGRSGSKSKPPPIGVTPGEPKARSFIGTVDVKASTAKMRLVQIAEEILQQLVSDPQAVVNVTVEISAEFPNCVSDQETRAVSENATILGFKNKTRE